MRNLSASKPGDLASRSSSAGMNQVTNQAHAKYKVTSPVTVIYLLDIH